MIDPLIGTSIDISTGFQQQHDVEAPRGGTGSQVLPVALDLPDDFDGNPVDGMQYLFTVRQEASKHPLISRVENPYQVIEEDRPIAATASRRRLASKPTEEWRSRFLTQFQQLRQRLIAAPTLSSFPVTSSSITAGELPLPQDEGAWHLFIHGRKSKSASVIASGASESPFRIPTAPAIANEVIPTSTSVDSESLAAAKSALLASLELDAPDEDSGPLDSPPLSTVSTKGESSPPHYPTPSLILSIPTFYIPRLLSHFESWQQSRQETYESIISFVPSTIFAPPSLRRKAAASTTTPTTKAPNTAPKVVPRPPLMTAHELHWLLSLLTRLDSLLDGSDIASVRSLTRAIHDSIVESEIAVLNREKDRKGPRALEEKQIDEDEAERRALGWMIIAVISGFWGQTDLWED